MQRLYSFKNEISYILDYFRHEHFIHNSDLFKQNDSNNVMSLTSLTKDNFEDLLKLHHRLLMNSHLSCHDTK